MLDNFLVLTNETVNQIRTLSNSTNALDLYLFYYQHAKSQNTNQPWATASFCAKGLGWSATNLDRVRSAKKGLIKLGLIKDIPAAGRNSKAYIKIKYITTEKTLSNIFKQKDVCTNENYEGIKNAHKCLKNKKNKCLKKKDKSKDSSKESGDSYKLNKSRIKRSIVPIKKKPIVPKSKYSHTTTDLRNYNECKLAGATKHQKDTKAEINSLDKLHVLFSPRLKKPYHSIYVPDKYIDFKWDMDEFLETFKFHLEYAPKYNSKVFKSIGTFIFCEGFNGHKSWSPLLHWHQKMNKTAAGELTDEGNRLLSSMKRAKVDGLKDLDSEIINKVSKELFEVSDKYTFVDGTKTSMRYPFGVVDALSKFVKEKTNNMNFKLVYITKNGFVDEFLDVAKQRNIIKKKINGRRSLYA